MAVSLLDPAKQEAFAEKLVAVLNHGALAVMTSIGHRTGLFDAMAALPPASSAAIAEAAGLDERYVREWLGAMTTGGVVEHDPADNTFVLPAEHAALLTRAAAQDNIAALSQYIGLMGAVESDIVECFRKGGGVPYAKFHRFHEVMAEDSGQSVLPVLFDLILPLAPGLTERLQHGIDVLDLGCGRGKAVTLMAEAFPESRFMGYDLCEDAVVYGREEAAKKGLANLAFETMDATHWNEREAFDLVCTFDAIHDQAKPRQVLKSIYTALRPGGVYLMQDIKASCHLHKNADHPLGTLLYTVSCTHCMTVSLAQGGDGLGTMWGVETALAMLEEAGFRDVKVHELAHDMQNAYFVCRK